MCHRDGFFVAPKVVPEPVILGFFGRPYPGMRPNKPIDTTVASLFDTAYVPPALQRSNLIWDLYNLWVKWMFGAISGTSGGFDQWVGAVSSGRRHVDSCKCFRNNFPTSAYCLAPQTLLSKPPRPSHISLPRIEARLESGTRSEVSSSTSRYRTPMVVKSSLHRGRHGCGSAMTPVPVPRLKKSWSSVTMYLPRANA